MTIEETLRDMAKTFRAFSEQLDRLASNIEGMASHRTETTSEALDPRKRFPKAPDFAASKDARLKLEILSALAISRQKGQEAISSKEIAAIIGEERKRRLGSAQPVINTASASVARAANRLIETGVLLRTKIGRRVLYTIPTDTVVISGQGKDLGGAISNLASREKGRLKGHRSYDTWIILDTGAGLESQGFPTQQDLVNKVCDMLNQVGLQVAHPSMMIWHSLGTLPRSTVNVVAKLATAQLGKPTELESRRS